MPNEDISLTVITPTRNAERFLRETIESVLGQDVDLTYWIQDACSTDATRQIVAEYGDRIQMFTEPDSGAPDALNRALARCRTSHVCYIAADDRYVAGGLRQLVEAARRHPSKGVIYGKAELIDDQGAVLGPYETEEHNPRRLAERNYICQPATILRTELISKVGGFRTDRPYTFDYDLWLRLSKETEFLYLPILVAESRMHQDTITMRKRGEVFLENIHLLQETSDYVPYSWLYSYLCYQRDGRDQYFEPLRPSVAAHLEALRWGLQVNAKYPWRFIQEWTSRSSPKAVFRQTSRILFGP